MCGRGPCCSSGSAAGCGTSIAPSCDSETGAGTGRSWGCGHHKKMSICALWTGAWNWRSLSHPSHGSYWSALVIGHYSHCSCHQRNCEAYSGSSGLKTRLSYLSKKAGEERREERRRPGRERLRECSLPGSSTPCSPLLPPPHCTGVGTSGAAGVTKHHHYPHLLCWVDSDGWSGCSVWC